MIRLSGVSKSFGGSMAVKNVSFEVQEGENLILLGTSGCGKTTTLKMINRLINPDDGQIEIDGKNITATQPENLRRQIGYVMQNIGLFPHYTVAENIAVVPRLLKWDKQKIVKRITALIHKLHLPENCLNMFPGELSGGQQQRVGLARALVADPPVLLMDEPFGALDNVTRASIQQEFLDLAELQRKTIVMVTHDVQEAFELADRICLMDQGVMIQIGTPQELLYNPINAFAKSFLDGQRLSLELKVTRLSHIWDFLPRSVQASDHKILSSNLSIWNTLETLRSQRSSSATIANDQHHLKEITFEEVTAAFNQYQNTQSHE